MFYQHLRVIFTVKYWVLDVIINFHWVKTLVFNPLIPNIHIQILQTDLYTFPSRRC